MAYRVSSDSAHRVTRRAPHRRRDRTLTRNAALTGVALASVSLAAAGAALFGGHRGFEAAPGQTPKSLQIALVDPAPPPVAWRDPRVAVATPGPHVLRVAVRSVPLPRERPAALAAMQATPQQPVQVADAEPAGSLGEPAREAAVADAPTATPASSFQPPQGEEKIASALAAAPNRDREDPILSATLMSYAPSREMVFADDITGSIGNAAGERLAAPPENAGAPRPSARARREREEMRAATKAANETVSTRPLHTAAAPHRPARKLTPFEKLYGPVRVASLTPTDTGREDDGGNDSGLPRGPYDRHTAVYVLADKKVYLPDGRALEAHSGYGDKLDDARYVAVRMRGATPPHMYDLKLRESLFHGVEAIRLNPVGGDGAIFGRAGLLAHTYMLGPNGQSNGCVSFRDYDAFLDAYKSGAITRLAVIAKLD